MPTLGFCLSGGGMRENWGRLDDQSFCECGEVALARRRGWNTWTFLNVQKLFVSTKQRQELNLVLPILLGKNQKHGTTGTKPKIFTPNSWPKADQRFSLPQPLHPASFKQNFETVSPQIGLPYLLSLERREDLQIGYRTLGGLVLPRTLSLNWQATFCSGDYIFAFEGHFKQTLF